MNNHCLKQILLSVTVLVAAAFPVLGVSSGASFLKIGVGGRALGMGESYVAVADDVSALFWNPGGLVQAAQPEVMVVHNELYQTIKHEYAAFSLPLFGGVVGMSGTYLWMDGVEGRSSDSPDVERMIPVWDAAASIAYSREVCRTMSAGISIKGIHEQLDDKKAEGMALDAGVLYRPIKRGPSFGFAIQNIGYESAFVSEASPLPLNIKAGGADRYFNDRLLAACDGNYCAADNIWSVSAGFEGRIHPLFSVRAGYKYGSGMQTLGTLAGVSGGLGFKFSIYEIDYSFVPYGDLGQTHRMSLLARF